MNNNFSYAMIFAIGAAIGSVATWQLTKRYYKEISLEEIDSVKEVYARKLEAIKQTSDSDDSEPVIAEIDDSEDDEMSVMEYAKQLSKEGYTNYSNSEDAPSVNLPLADQIIEEDEEPDPPYVIPPEDFGDEEGYECITLTYYADDVLADDNDQRIVDIENVVGYKALESFGEYEEDVVHVINDKLRSYFEITRDLRTYSEVLKHKPYLMED